MVKEVNFQVGDFVEVFYQVNNHSCRGQVLNIHTYQITILVCHTSSSFLKDHIGYELRLNLDTRENPYIVIKKCETTLTEDDFLHLMHFALQVNDKAWFETLGERRKEMISVG